MVDLDEMIDELVELRYKSIEKETGMETPQNLIDREKHHLKDQYKLGNVTTKDISDALAKLRKAS